MAIPNYSAQAQNNRQMRRQERRQDRRAANATVPPSRTHIEGSFSGGQQSTASPHNYGGYNWGSGYQGPYTAPANTTNHPFYDPNATYTNQGGQHHQLQQGSDMYRMAAEHDPEGMYLGHLGRQGLGGLDARSLAAQGMYREFAGGYRAAKLNNNFEGNWADFVGQQDIGKLLDRMSSEQLGIDTTQYGGRTRWGMRGQ